jgi:hypothetical protein
MLHQDSTPPKRSLGSTDEVRTLLKRAARRGPWRRSRFLVALALIAVVLGLGIWWLWPRGPRPRLVVTAFDQVAVVDRPVTLRAATETVDGAEARRQGHEVFFEENRGLPPGASGTTQKVETDAQGFAGSSWKFGGPARAIDFEVRYTDENAKPAWFNSNEGRVFVLDPGSRLLVFDLDVALQASDRQARNKALHEAMGKGWRIVYLAVGADSPADYRKVRDKARSLIQTENDPIPDGPVLARASFADGQSGLAAFRLVLKDLQQSYQGPVIFLWSDKGLQLCTVAGDGAFAGPPVPLENWPGLAAALEARDRK